MIDQINGGIEFLSTPEESELFERQAKAQASGDVSKWDADYQNEPKDGEQCSECAFFVPGFPDNIAGYCSKVMSFKGPAGMIFEDGWCKFFKVALPMLVDLTDIYRGAAKLPDIPS